MMGCYGHRPGAHRRRRRRAVRRRARDRVAARDRAVRRRAGRARQGGHATSARSPTGSTTSCAPPASTCSTTTATSAPARSSPTPSCSACPLRLTVGRRTLDGGEVEVQLRRGRESAQRAARGRRGGGGGPVAEPPVDGATSRLDRSAALVGPRPLGPAAGPQTARRRSRCNPWTIPNAIGFVRLALIPVFLVLALGSRRAARTRCRRSSSPSSAGATTPTGSPRASPASTAPGRAAGPAHRPAAGDLPASSSAGTSSCCRAGASRVLAARELF